MRTFTRSLLTAAVAGLIAAPAMADEDHKGMIDSVDAQAQSFVVEGKTFYVNEDTDFDDDIESFADLKKGLMVDVEYEMKDGKMWADEIDREEVEKSTYEQ